jgi:hypothetical protein
MFHRKLSENGRANRRLASETHLVVFEAFVFAILTKKGDQSDYHLDCEEDHPEVVHALYKARGLPFAKLLIAMPWYASRSAPLTNLDQIPCRSEMKLGLRSS